MQMDIDHVAGRSRGVKTLRSDHLYQLHAYMSHHAQAKLHPGTVEGLLLYPLVDDPIEVELYSIRVRTIDLATSWPEIKSQLLELLRPVPFLVGPAPAQLKSQGHNERRAIVL